MVVILTPMVLAYIVTAILPWPRVYENRHRPDLPGHRKLYSQESPEVWFEDFGEGQLAGGKAHIDLDPLFLETVTIDDQHPMKVFIQLNDDCNGVYVQRQATGFEVRELSGGNSSAHFTYRVMAKRKGFETARLEAAGDTPKVAALPAPRQSSRRLRSCAPGRVMLRRGADDEICQKGLEIQGSGPILVLRNNSL